MSEQDNIELYECMTISKDGRERHCCDTFQNIIEWSEYIREKDDDIREIRIVRLDRKRREENDNLA